MFIVVSGGTARNMVLVNTALPTKTTMKASFQRAIDAAKESMHGLIAVFMMESGRKIR